MRDFFSYFKIKKYPSLNQWVLLELEKIMKYTKELKKFTTLTGWRQFLRILNKKERIIFFVFLILFLSSSFFLLLNFYFKNTELKPARGGIYIEGVIGQPRFINPVYSKISDVDQDLVTLTFSGLFKYNNQGQIVQNLVQDYKIEEDGKIYEVYLKENLFWSDGLPLTADDVIFTIKTIQNPDFKSPLRVSWLGVEVEKISDLGVRFKLRNPYAPFLENLIQEIIPEHIWQDIPPENFPLAIHNLKPVGSGPYKFKNLIHDKQGKIISLDLVKNPKYHGEGPYIFQISFRFYNNEEDLIRAYRAGEIKGFSLISPENLKGFARENLIGYNFSLPRYFAVFFNPQESKILTDKNIRQAINYATNKAEIVEKILLGYGKAVYSPILPEIYGFSAPSKTYQFDQKAAEELLEKSGFVERQGKRIKINKKQPAFQFKSDLQIGSRGKEVEELQKCLANPPAGGPEIYPQAMVSGYFGNATRKAVIKFQEKYAKDILQPLGLTRGTGRVRKTTREKLNELCFPAIEEFTSLKFSLATVNQPILISVAELLKEQWLKIGIEIKIETFDISYLEKEIIKPRNYESLLFGKALTMVPDPFPFWHSAQIKDPGLNLAIFENKEVDKFLEDARKTLDQEIRKELLESFQERLLTQAPAVFLYNPDFLYFLPREIKGVKPGTIIEPAKRFSETNNWYIKTKRAWK